MFCSKNAIKDKICDLISQEFIQRNLHGNQRFTSNDSSIQAEIHDVHVVIMAMFSPKMVEKVIF